MIFKSLGEFIMWLYAETGIWYWDYIKDEELN